MKNISFLLIIISMAIAFSCKREVRNIPTPESFIISGKLLNYPKKQFVFFEGLSNKDNGIRLNLAEDGTFKDTLRGKSGYYNFFSGGGTQYVYLEDGMDLSITFDDKDFKNTITYSGKGSSVNNYYLYQNTILHKGKKDFDVDAKTFKAKEIENKDKLLKKLSLVNDASKKYIATEKRHIYYRHLFNLLGYKRIKQKGSQEEITLPSDFFSELEILKLDHTGDYELGLDYVPLINNYYNLKANELAQKEGMEPYLAYFKLVSANTSDIIKNALLFRRAKPIAYASKNNPKIDAFIAAYNNASTNNTHKEQIARICKAAKTLNPGQPSPIFVDYENYKGGTTSLSDFKGKYVFIDVWATWCTACKKEIPFLEEIEKAYHDKNIEFLSISVDRQKDHDKWENMVKEKNMKGIQLLADKDLSSDFVIGYLINSIPRFLLIDPQGNIVTANGPFPSNKEAISKLFSTLAI